VFRVLDLPPNGPPIAYDGDPPVEPPPPGGLRWIDLIAPDAAELDLLKQRFGFDTIAIDDCAHYGRQSKLDDYGKYLFVVVHAFTEGDDHDITIHEIHAFLADTYLVTVHDDPLPATELVWRQAATDRAVLGRGPSWALYRTVVGMLEATEPLVEVITDELDEVERELIAGEQAIDLPPVFGLKRTIVAMRRVLRPLRDTLAAMHRRHDPRLSPRASMHFREAAERVGRLVDMVEEAREVAVTILNAHGAVQAQKTSEVVKRLTIFSAIFLPLAFIVGFFGQNFDHLPFGSGAMMALMLASIVLIPAGLYEWFRRNDWL
jgi:magnesium transporter